MPRYGTSFSIRSSASDRPNSAAAFFASGLISFICPSKAPMISTSDTPPISPVMCFHDQPRSRLMSNIFSVSSSRLIDPFSFFDDR
jgi:hypothetical protein